VTIPQPNPLIYDLNFEQLIEFLDRNNFPKFRAEQIWQGLYQHLWNSTAQFTTLPKSLKDLLDNHFRFTGLESKKVIQSQDHETTKTLFYLWDGKAIESVLMKYNTRRTLCISTQAGCAMGCVFCATGQMGFKRHLTSGEIIEQVLFYARHLQQSGEQVTNVVLMGMGEPFHNYDATMEAIDRLNLPLGLNLGARRFTISTVGLVPMIDKFANENRQVNLAISLHAANDEERSKLLPINKKYPLEVLLQSCRNYVTKTHRRITFEWALIAGKNDSEQTAKELAALLRGILCHVNVIPLNPTTQYAGNPSSQASAQKFKEILEKQGIPCTIRIRRGMDIQAGCGQLATLDTQSNSI